MLDCLFIVLLCCSDEIMICFVDLFTCPQLPSAHFYGVSSQYAEAFCDRTRWCRRGSSRSTEWAVLCTSHYLLPERTHGHRGESVATYCRAPCRQRQGTNRELEGVGGHYACDRGRQLDDKVSLLGCACVNHCVLIIGIWYCVMCFL